MTTLQEKYKDEITKKLMEQFKYTSKMEVPRLKKITLNMGVGEAVGDKKFITNAVEDLTKIAGQKPVITKARISVAGFKIRKGMPIGCKVTLRRKRMYDFLQRLISIAIPRIRDFRGFSASGFDDFGNYNLGIREQIVFPEIEYDKIDIIRGLNIAFTTSAKTKEEGKALLAAFGFPFKD